ncbi:MAG: hypothetical protein KGM43_19085 [Planctomycetota bacterium]|nr:hypothetical protein [Planctomycetota bacterium]
MITFLFLLAFVDPAFPDEPANPSKEQLLRIAKSSLAGLGDIEFSYEGSAVFTGPKNIPVKETGDNLNYQGQYVLRRDGSFYREYYENPAGVDGRPAWELSAYLATSKNENPFEHLRIIADLKRCRLQEVPAAVLNEPGASGRFFLLPEMIDKVGSKDLRYVPIGWESLDGTRCFRFELRYGSADVDASKDVYWVDVERGCNPLRVDYYMGKQLRYRILDVQLRSFPGPGKTEVWVPCSSKVTTHRWSDGFHEKPYYTEKYNVINGTLMFNKVHTAPFFKVASHIDDAVKQALKREPEVYNRESLQQNLEKHLAEAEGQSKLLDASVAADEGFWNGSTIQSALIVLGVVLVGGVGYYKWKNR